MNRRHKAILFTTLVLAGSLLLTGATLKEALGVLILGVAFAWAAGSDTASRCYTKLAQASSHFYIWIKPLLAMILAGCVLGVALIFSRANPVVVVILMCLFGVFVAPFTSIASTKNWLKILVWILAVAGFVLSDFGVLSLDKSSLNIYAERYGELTSVAFVALISGIWWLSKGWKAVLEGVSSPSVETAQTDSAKRAIGQYVSLFLGFLIVTFWLGMLTWSGSSDWAYDPQAVSKSKLGQQALAEAALGVLLLCWPYAAWKKILARESNAHPQNLRRHKRVAMAALAIFTVVISLGILLGAQNGSDRMLTEQITKGIANLVEISGKIVAIKQREMRTTADYIQAFSEIEPLETDFDSSLERLTDLYKSGQLRDESRGPMNIQRLYKNRNERLQTDSDAVALLKNASDLTKQETATIREMATLPEGEQLRFWQREFTPYFAQEQALRQKALAIQTRAKTLE